MKYICIWLIKFYRKVLSPLKGKPCCRFVPTCSQYAIEAFQKRGFFVGLALTAGIVFMGEKRRRHSAAWQPVLIRVLPGAVYGKKTDSAGAEE